MSGLLDDEENACHPDLKADVRKALSKVLGGKPYVIFVDCTSLDDMKDDTVDVHLIAPEYHHSRHHRIRHGYSEDPLPRRLTWERRSIRAFR